MRKRYLVRDPEDPMGLFVDPVMGFVGLMFFLVILLLIDTRGKPPPPPPSKLRFAPITQPACGVGLPYVMTLPVQGGTGDRRFSDPDGSLKALGLVLDEASGTITGVVTEPIAGEKAKVGIVVEDAAGGVARADFELTCQTCAAYRGANPASGECVLFPLDEGDARVSLVRSQLPPAREGLPYQEDLGVQSWRNRTRVFVTGEPPGLKLDQGMLKGSPSAAGTYTLRAGAQFRPLGVEKNDGRHFGLAPSESTITLEVLGPLRLVTALPTARVGEQWVASVFSGKTRATEKVDVSGLPPGLTTRGDGVLSGLPAQAGTFAIEVKALLENEQFISGKLTLLVLPPAPSAEVAEVRALAFAGEPVRVDLPYRGLVEPLTPSAADLPAGLELRGLSITGSVARPGRYEVTGKTQDATGVEKPFTVRLQVVPMPKPLAIVAPQQLNIVAGSAVAVPLREVGGLGKTQLTIKGDMPPGLRFNEGILSGTVGVGVWNLQLQATDDASATATAQTAIQGHVAQPRSLAIVTDALPAALVGEPYRAVLAAVGAVGELAWSAPEGLPSWLVLEGSALVGTPPLQGEDTFAISVEDSAGRAAPVRKMSLRRLDADHSQPVVLSRDLPPAIPGQPYRAWLAAEGGFGGYTWNAVGLPTWLKTEHGYVAGTPPTGPSEHKLRVTVKDARGRQSEEVEIRLRVAQAPVPTLTLATAVAPDRNAWWWNLKFALGAAYGVVLTLLIGRLVRRQRSRR